MDGLVVDFVRLLREHRVRVSPAEALDGLSALESVGIGERATVRDALRATLIKDAEDVPMFDRLFDLHFAITPPRPGAQDVRWGHTHEDEHGGSPTELRFGEDLEGDPLDPDHTHEPPSPIDLRRYLDEQQLAPGNDMHGEPERLRLSVFGSQLMLSRSQDALEQAMNRMTHQLRVRRARSLSPGPIAPESGAEELPIDLTGTEFIELLDELRDQQVDESLVQALEARSDEIMAALPQLLKELMERQERLRAAAEEEPAPGAGILRRSLELSPADQRALEMAIRRLGRQLQGAHTRRRRIARRGEISVAHTLRRNMVTDGVPFRPVFRRRREQRPRLVVLCDVSLSTRNMARFWLQLVYELQGLFSRVRTFAFVADLVETTQLFEEQGLGGGVESLFRGGLIDVDENSDFGRASEQMRSGHLEAVTRRTTVVVLGDGRNNGRPPNTDALAEIAGHARRLLWLTPEPRWGWQLGSCDMELYEPHCDAVEVVRSVDELGTFADLLLSRAYATT